MYCRLKPIVDLMSLGSREIGVCIDLSSKYPVILHRNYKYTLLSTLKKPTTI